MRERLVINTGPLIALAKGGVLALVGALPISFVTPQAGRRLATAVGLRVVGTLGLLLRAKRDGLLPALAPVVEKLKASGIWYDHDLVRRVLIAAGEE